MRRSKIAIACLVVLALLATLCLGCAEEEEEGKVTIVIGNITDLTGPAATAVIPVTYALEDVVKYVNEEDPIPDVELKVVSYDARYDPSRDIPGYEWVQERGAKIVYTPMPTTTWSLSPFVAGDKMVLLTGSPTPEVLDPPGWIFCITMMQQWELKALLEWVSEEDWDYEGMGRKPKIGSAGWMDPFHIAMTDAIKEYVDDHPDKFEYVAGPIVPMGGVTWTGEIETLKDCDYVYPPSTGMGTATFISDFRTKGYTAKWVGTAAQTGFWGLHLDKAGPEALEGGLFTSTVGWYTDQYPLVTLAKDLVHRYHGAEADDILYSGGSAYLISICSQFIFTDIIREVVAEVGAENFDSQAFYNAAVNFGKTYEGFREWGFSETRRVAMMDTAVYEVASDGDLIKISDWIPVIK